MTLGDARDKRSELYGVRGWLGFLCVTLLYLSPGAVLIRLAANWRTIAAGPEIVIGELFVIALVGFGVFVGIRLNQIHPSAVRLAKIYFLILIAVNLMSLLAIVFAPVSVLTRFSLVRDLAISAAWLTYLYRSERVRVTYSPAAAEKISDVFA